MSTPPTIFVVDPDEASWVVVRSLASVMSLHCETYASGQDFLDAYDPSRPGCLILEIKLPKISGLQIQQILNEKRAPVPLIFVTDKPSVSIAVHAMRLGAILVLEKPCREPELWSAVQEAIQLDERRRQKLLSELQLEKAMASLTDKEYMMLRLIAAGKAKEEIAAELAISMRTIQYYRMQLMKKLNTKTYGELLTFIAKLDSAWTSVQSPHYKSPPNSQAAKRSVAIGVVANP